MLLLSSAAMKSYNVGVVVVLLLVVVFEMASGDITCEEDSVNFDENYFVLWGGDHALLLNQGKRAQLTLDKSSGAGFASKLNYTSGWFRMRMKLPPKDSGGVITTFYLISHLNNRDELDFEFLGNREGKPITLQTNVIINGNTEREQRTLLWFDPTADFHSYQILWNQHQIVFFVDDTPIRVFENKTNIGASYPTQPMRIETSVWDGSAWATDGGKTKIDWSHAPFVAFYEGFKVDGCSPESKYKTNPAEDCYSSKYLWNRKEFWKMNAVQKKAYDNVRKKYMNYDYCTDKKRFPKGLPVECR